MSRNKEEKRKKSVGKKPHKVYHRQFTIILVDVLALLLYHHQQQRLCVHFMNGILLLLVLREVGDEHQLISSMPMRNVIPHAKLPND